MQAAIALLLLLLTSCSAHAQSMPAEFIDAATVVDGLVIDMRYFGADNFVGKRIDGYEAPRCLLTRPAATALAAAQRDLARRAGGGSDPAMGTRFDYFSPKSWPADNSVGKAAQRSRALLAAAMTRVGFQPYDQEWWHFTLRNEPFPASY